MRRYWIIIPFCLIALGLMLTGSDPAYTKKDHTSSTDFFRKDCTYYYELMICCGDTGGKKYSATYSTSAESGEMPLDVIQFKLESVLLKHSLKENPADRRFRERMERELQTLTFTRVRGGMKMKEEMK